MYLETGNTGTAGELAITKGSDTGNRNFQIKVTYFTCNSLAKAPAGCTQYFTGKSGNFQSYNHQGGQLLQSMNYNNCFRQEEGYCNIQVREAVGSTIDAFFLSAIADQAETNCMLVSRITLASPISGSFCGDVLSPIAADTIPSVITSSPGASFQVGVQSLTGVISGKTGFNLDYNQVPCA
ncbi:uncharacterized protein LOC131885358 [Tigriopus californicus]|uniref:uncharacterized protein LOC131885358 n=1 Tax=Tigriopus californicus TaxID=6832 RepID=UPI0027DA026F|nr:uncharacterized protein LOC131885358 [Tigriopus californicus]